MFLVSSSQSDSIENQMRTVLEIQFGCVLEKRAVTPQEIITINQSITAISKASLTELMTPHTSSMPEAFKTFCDQSQEVDRVVSQNQAFKGFLSMIKAQNESKRLQEDNLNLTAKAEVLNRAKNELQGQVTDLSRRGRVQERAEEDELAKAMHLSECQSLRDEIKTVQRNAGIVVDQILGAFETVVLKLNAEKIALETTLSQPGLDPAQKESLRKQIEQYTQLIDFVTQILKDNKTDGLKVNLSDDQSAHYQTKVAELTRSMSSMQSQMQAIQQQKAEYEQKYNQTSKEKGGLRDVLEEMRAELGILRKENEVIETEYKNLKNKLESAQASYSIVKRQLDEATHELNHYKSEYEKLAKIDRLQQCAEEMRQQETKLTLEENDNLRGRLVELEEKLRRTEQECKVAQACWDVLKNKNLQG